MNAEVDRYAVMGNPVQHSLSPLIHAWFAEQTHQALVYEAIEVPVDGFPEAVARFQAEGGRGLNVTVPFKEAAWELADERSVRAEEAGAVNTLVLRDDGGRYGDNTDGVGLVRDLERLGWSLAGRRLLILGAGGAVRGVLGPLLAAAPREVVIANRTLARAEALVARFAARGSLAARRFEDLDGAAFDVVINGTSASLAGELPPVPEACVRGACVYDMMYGARPTPFLEWATAAGARHGADGLGMLVEQAAEAFFVWRGVRPQTAQVLRDLRERLARGC